LSSARGIVVEGVSSELVKLLFALLPGFVAAWVFYGLTAHPKTSSFERVVQALIFTAIVQPITSGIGWALNGIGQVVGLGAWSEDCRLFWSLLVALDVGLVVAYFANNDRFHSWMRTRGLTSRTSYPSEWFSAFSRQKRWIILHLAGERRLFGWPEESPDHPDSGHFVMDQPAKSVRMVEFLKQADEITASPDELHRIDTVLTDLQKKDEDYGSQSPPAGTEPTDPGP
jgi:hypothetical protein